MNRSLYSLFLPLMIAVALVGLSSAQANASIALPGDVALAVSFDRNELDSDDLAPAAPVAGIPNEHAAPLAPIGPPRDSAELLLAASDFQQATNPSSSSAGSPTRAATFGFAGSPALLSSFSLPRSLGIQAWLTPARFLALPAGHARGLLRPPRNWHCG